MLALVSSYFGVTSLLHCHLSCGGVNDDDFVGTAPDPLEWSAGALAKRRRWYMQYVIMLCCLAQLFIGTSF